MPGGLRLIVRLTPRGGRDAVDGARDGALRVRVAAPAVDGAANAALVGFLAKALGVAKTDVALVSGHKARVKTLALTGDAETLGARLAALAG